MFVVGNDRCKSDFNSPLVPTTLIHVCVVLDSWSRSEGACLPYDQQADRRPAEGHCRGEARSAGIGNLLTILSNHGLYYVPERHRNTAGARGLIGLIGRHQRPGWSNEAISGLRGLPDGRWDFRGCGRRLFVGSLIASSQC